MHKRLGEGSMAHKHGMGCKVRVVRSFFCAAMLKVETYGNGDYIPKAWTGPTLVLPILNRTGSCALNSPSIRSNARTAQPLNGKPKAAKSGPYEKLNSSQEQNSGNANNPPQGRGI